MAKCTVIPLKFEKALEMLLPSDSKALFTVFKK